MTPVRNKYIQYLLHGILMGLFFLSVSCADDIPVSGPDSDDVEIQGDRIILRSSLVIPEQGEVETRSVGTTADLSSLHLYLLEFYDNGDPIVNYLTGIYDAEEETVSGSEVIFKVSLRAVSTPRILHLVALPRTETLDIEYGSEANVMPSLTTGEGVDAYWRRLSFPDGYASQDDQGKIVVNPLLKESLTHVALVRNFARIDVRSTVAESQFQLLGFKVMNTPVQGSIVPWIGSTRKFPDMLDGSAPRPYSTMAAEYGGFLPADTFFENPVAGGNITVEDDLTPRYIYEAPVSRSDRTFLIVKGRTPKGIRYFKLDIGSTDGQGVFKHYPLLRNYMYRLNITKVNADGMETAQAAANGPVYNNLSFDFDTEELIKVSDGNEVIQVNFTKLIVTNTNDTTITFRYRYTQANDSTKALNTGVSIIDLKAGPVIKSVIGPVNGTGVFKNYKEYTLTLNKATAVTKTQSFVVVKGSTGVGRTMTLVSHVPWTYDNLKIVQGAVPNWTRNSVEGKVVNKQGAAATIFFDLPEDLPEAVFPMDFTIEVERQNMENYYIGNMSVTEGITYWPELVSTKPIYRTVIKYVKRITWNDYNSRPVDAQNTTGATLMPDELTGREVHRVSARMMVSRALTGVKFPLESGIHLQQDNYKSTVLKYDIVEK